MAAKELPASQPDNIPKVPLATFSTRNPRQLRILHWLLKGPQSRADVDRIAGASNGPDVIHKLRAKGLDILCHHVHREDIDGKPSYYGVYVLTPTDRRKLARWLNARTQAEIDAALSAHKRK